MLLMDTVIQAQNKINTSSCFKNHGQDSRTEFTAQADEEGYKRGEVYDKLSKRFNVPKSTVRNIVVKNRMMAPLQIRLDVVVRVIEQ